VSTVQTIEAKPLLFLLRPSATPRLALVLVFAALVAASPPRSPGRRLVPYRFIPKIPAGSRFDFSNAPAFLSRNETWSERIFDEGVFNHDSLP